MSDPAAFHVLKLLLPVLIHDHRIPSVLEGPLQSFAQLDMPQRVFAHRDGNGSGNYCALRVLHQSFQKCAVQGPRGRSKERTSDEVNDHAGTLGGSRRQENLCLQLAIRRCARFPFWLNFGRVDGPIKVHLVHPSAFVGIGSFRRCNVVVVVAIVIRILVLISIDVTITTPIAVSIAIVVVICSIVVVELIVIGFVVFVIVIVFIAIVVVVEVCSCLSLSPSICCHQLATGTAASNEAGLSYLFM
mmetsp:Transcript_1655/g.4544  ORF Transcript_1655/g.4544 Transcript_1655/m.4544 type:complete len:245 (-) Transcript_1655:307-1041(-)